MEQLELPFNRLATFKFKLREMQRKQKEIVGKNISNFDVRVEVFKNLSIEGQRKCLKRLRFDGYYIFY